MKKQVFYFIGVYIFSITTLVNCTSSTDNTSQKQDIDVVESEGQETIQIDEETSLVIDKGFDVVKANCGGCHSHKLVSQNRMSRSGWKNTIVWMQKNHNLWELGANEPIILDYLAKNYTPKAHSRRKKLENIEWYELKN